MAKTKAQFSDFWADCFVMKDFDVTRGQGDQIGRIFASCEVMACEIKSLRGIHRKSFFKSTKVILEGLHKKAKYLMRGFSKRLVTRQ
jgi:hypothetical protein